ncbi:MAG: peptide ABC transporter substrate-binding protein [Treponema sp.]
MQNKTKKIITLLSCLSAHLFLQNQIYPQNSLEDFLKSFNQVPAEPLEVQKELTVIQSASALNLNPHTSVYANDAQILNSAYEGLFSYNPQTAEPDFALAVNYTTSRDQLLWTFTLRDDAYFSDGKKITSKDVKESWLNLLATPGAYYSSFLDVIKGAAEYRQKKGSRDDVAIIANDDYTLSVELKSPVSYLPKLLCHHSLAVVSKNSTCCSGPYVISAVKKDRLVLEKNKYYYDERNVRIPKITVLFSNDENENSYQFNIGNVQWINANCNVKSILQQEAVRLDAVFGTHFFFFKLGNSPYLTEKVRAALLEAVPWESLREGSLFPATTFIYPTAGYQSPSPLAYTNYEHSKLLMDEAKKELKLSASDTIELTFAIPSGDSIYAAAKILKKSWEKIGVKLNIKQISDATYLNGISKTKADLFIYTWIGDFCDPVAFLELFRSDSTLNESNWKNKEFDRLLDKANSTLNETERLEILSQAEDLLLTNSMVIPICHSLDVNVINSNEISGWSENPLNIHPFKDMFFRKPVQTGPAKTIAMENRIKNQFH